jgi:hypothetical protein
MTPNIKATVFDSGLVNFLAVSPDGSKSWADSLVCQLVHVHDGSCAQTLLDAQPDPKQSSLRQKFQALANVAPPAAPVAVASNVPLV